VYLLPWICIDGYDVNRVRLDFGHMPDNWLWRGQCVRLRDIPASRVRMQPRLRIHINYDHRMCRFHSDVPRVWCRVQLHREWRPANGVFLLPWLFIDDNDIKHMRHNICNVLNNRMRRGECVCRWVGAGDPVHLQCWLRVNFDHDGCLRWHDRNLLNDRLQCGQRVCGRVRTARRLHLQRRLRVHIYEDNRMRG
jgi:hypothetical protein